MIDSVWIKSPFICESVAMKIEKGLTGRYKVNNNTGEIISQFHSETIYLNSHTHFSAVRIEVRRDYYKHTYDRIIEVHNPIEKIQCRPYLYMNFSLAKFLFGQNVILGNYDLSDIYFVIKELEKSFDVELPHYTEWALYQFDFSQCYLFNDEQQTDYIYSLQSSLFSRRTAQPYFKANKGIQSVYFKGSITLLKFYKKGDEQRKNNKKDIITKFGLEWAEEYFSLCDNLLRVEVSFRRQYFLNRFRTLGENSQIHLRGCIPIAWYPSNKELIECFETEVQKVLKMKENNSVIDMNEIWKYVSSCTAQTRTKDALIAYVKLCREEGQAEADSRFIRKEIRSGGNKESAKRKLRRYKSILLKGQISLMRVDQNLQQCNIIPAEFGYFSNKALGLWEKVDVFHVKKVVGL